MIHDGRKATPTYSPLDLRSVLILECLDIEIQIQERTEIEIDLVPPAVEDQLLSTRFNAFSPRGVDDRSPLLNGEIRRTIALRV